MVRNPFDMVDSNFIYMCSAGITNEHSIRKINRLIDYALIDIGSNTIIKS